MPLHSGDTFAGYRIVRLLGSGGMGEVYLAEHPRLPRHDALKILPSAISADQEFRQRFEREADLASKLWHPNIVGVHDRGEFNGQLWIAMDYIDGLDAARLLAQSYPSGMPVHMVVTIVAAVGGALDYAHDRGLLHRDVKPANIMLTHTDEGNEQRIILADFGIARSIDDISGLTATNMTVGTVAYSAPEQLLGEEIDGRADQYALAATAYHLLTGGHLFPHSNPAVVISRHLSVAPPALGESHPELSRLDSVLSTALAKHPNDRFRSCSDFAQRLAEQARAESSISPVAATKPATALPKSASGRHLVGAEEKLPGQSASGSSRRRWLISIVALAVVLVVSVIAAMWRPWASGQPPRNAGSSTQPTAESPPASSAAPSPPTPPVFSAKAIDSVLLTPEEVNDILGTYATNAVRGRIGLMKVDRSSYGMVDNSDLVEPPSCVGVVFGAEHAVYADTGFVAMRDQTFSSEPYVYEANRPGPQVLEQTVTVFPSADRARSVMASAQNRWTSCATGEVSQKEGPESGYGWQLGSVNREGDLLVVPMASNGAMTGARACQQVLGLRENVVIGTRTCHDVEQSTGTQYDSVQNTWPVDPGWAMNDAKRLGNAMLDKVKF